jgi:hypothetical protein
MPPTEPPAVAGGPEIAEWQAPSRMMPHVSGEAQPQHTRLAHRLPAAVPLRARQSSAAALLCYNREVASRRVWRYRLGVRTEDSQSSNPGSIPGSATIALP